MDFCVFLAFIAGNLLINVLESEGMLELKKIIFVNIFNFG